MYTLNTSSIQCVLFLCFQLNMLHVKRSISMLPAPVNSESDTDLTSLNWLHSLTNILSVPSLPTPPDSPKSPARSADQNPKKLPHKIRFQMSESLLQWLILSVSLMFGILFQVWKVLNSTKKMGTKNRLSHTPH